MQITILILIKKMIMQKRKQVNEFPKKNDHSQKKKASQWELIFVLALDLALIFGLKNLMITNDSGLIYTKLIWYNDKWLEFFKFIKYTIWKK